MQVLAPAAGKVTALAEVPDPVFSNQLVGAGCAVDPVLSCTKVTSPISGKIVKIHPHAFVVAGDSDVNILVHVGIDTVKLQGEGFTLHASEGDQVDAGQLILEWNPADVVAKQLSPMVMLALLDSDPDSVDVIGIGDDVEPGAVLFEA